MAIIWALFLRGLTWPRAESSKTLMTWLVSSKTLRMLEICSIKILKLNFPFKTFFSIHNNFWWPFVTVLINTIDKKKKPPFARSKLSRQVRCNHQKKRCLLQDKEIYFQLPNLTKLENFQRKYRRSSKSYKSTETLKQNIKFLHCKIGRDKYSKTED